MPGTTSTALPSFSHDQHHKTDVAKRRGGGNLLGLFYSSRPWAHSWRTTNVCDVWPVWRQTYGYLPSNKASPPIDWYQIILPDDRDTFVLTTCPGLHSTAGRLGLEPATCWSQFRHPTAMPPSHTMLHWTLKIIGKEFQKNCYKTIFRKINTEEFFSNLHSLQIKTIFQEEISICKNLLLRYVIYIYGRDVTHWCQLNCECL